MIKLTATRPGHGLPIGWHRSFLGQFFGNADSKGLYTGWPGPVPDAYSHLGFVGLTFVAFRSNDLEEPLLSKVFRTPSEDQSWSGPSFDSPTDDENSGRESALIRTHTARESTANTTQTATSDDMNNRPRTAAKSPRRRSNSVCIQPDEVVEPSEGPAPKTQERRYSDHHSHTPHVRAEEHHGGSETNHGERTHNKRRMRHSTGSPPPRRNRHQYFMETTNTDELPDSSVFHDYDDTATDLPDLNSEKPRYKTRTHRRRSSATSTLSTQSDSLPRAPSPPRRDVPDAPSTPSPSPRKLRRRATAPTSPSSSGRFRSLSPIADYRSMVGDSSVPPFSPEFPEFPSMSTVDPAFYPNYPPSSPPPQASWSGYPPSSVPSTPRSPASTISYSSRPSSLSTHATTVEEDIVENINGEFTVERVRSVSDTPEGRYYKIRWATTWESKTSMRNATESGKYKVKEILESTYVNGKGLYRVRWEDTWEPATEIGDIDPVRAFLSDAPMGRREHGRRRTSFA
ncbi:hypothetical protein DRE_02245 [Drechslerella stenobrocha 248]|uniref:Chromo domain-containing protein n=1 Tax=Drechslerella stenobrocha 248 TaxID=1043628 RepID=W7HWG4_9PEZI|nr:hypothetical protein DRE_02245 [Drechslerella stenobrocha 248]